MKARKISIEEKPKRINGNSRREKKIWNKNESDKLKNKGYKKRTTRWQIQKEWNQQKIAWISICWKLRMRHTVWLDVLLMLYCGERKIKFSSRQMELSAETTTISRSHHKFQKKKNEDFDRSKKHTKTNFFCINIGSISLQLWRKYIRHALTNTWTHIDHHCLWYWTVGQNDEEAIEKNGNKMRESNENQFFWTLNGW